MPHILKLAQLAQDDGKAQVNIGSGRVEAELDMKAVFLRPLGVEQFFAPGRLRERCFAFPLASRSTCACYVRRKHLK